MFTTIHDNAIARWDEPEGTYAVAAEDGPTCPAGDWVTGENAARRVGSGEWYGNRAYFDNKDAAHAEIGYGGATFEAHADTVEEARDIATYFAFWAEGDVYALGFEPADGGDTQFLGDHYTADGLPPNLAEVKEALGR